MPLLPRRARLLLALAALPAAVRAQQISNDTMADAFGHLSADGGCTLTLIMSQTDSVEGDGGAGAGGDDAEDGVGPMPLGPGGTHAGAKEKFGCTNDQDEFMEMEMDDGQIEFVHGMAANGTLRYSETVVALPSGIQSSSNGTMVLPAGGQITILPDRRRLGPYALGPIPGDGVATVRHVLVFRVCDKGWMVNRHTPHYMSNKIFGSDGDDCNLASVYDACSVGKHKFVPGVRPPYDVAHLESAPGVIDLEMSNDFHSESMHTNMRAAKRWLNFHLGGTGNVASYVDHAIFIVPRGTFGAAGMGQVGGPFSIFQGWYFMPPGVLAHEIGHNLALAHSNFMGSSGYFESDQESIRKWEPVRWLKGDDFDYLDPPHVTMAGCPRPIPMGEYGDSISIMGGLDGHLYNEPGGRAGQGKMERCFNAPNNWQLAKNPIPLVGDGWFDRDAFVEVNPQADGAQTHKMIGVGEYHLQTDPRMPVAVRANTVSDHYLYVGFNGVGGSVQNQGGNGGIQSNSGPKRDRVIIYLKKGDFYSNSWEVTTLGAGDIYSNAEAKHQYYRGSPVYLSWPVGTHVVVEALCINAEVVPKVACVCVRAADQTCPANDCACDAVVPAPTPPPVAPTGSPSLGPTVCPEAEVSVEINADKHGSETSWELHEICGEVDVLVGDVAEDTYPDEAAGAVHERTFCTPHAQFRFTIKDRFNDGLCCAHGHGGYEVRINGNLMVAGGDFNSEEVKTFGSCSGPAPPPFTPPPSLSPTEPLPTPPPTLPPVPGADGVIVIHIYKAVFTYTPLDACVDLDGVEEDLPPDRPYACAFACSCLPGCAGFVETEAGCHLRGRGGGNHGPAARTTKTTVSTRTRPGVTSTSDTIDTTTALVPAQTCTSNAVFYAREVTIKLE